MSVLKIYRHGEPSRFKGIKALNYIFWYFRYSIPIPRITNYMVLWEPLFYFHCVTGCESRCFAVRYECVSRNNNIQLVVIVLIIKNNYLHWTLHWLVVWPQVRPPQRWTKTSICKDRHLSNRNVAEIKGNHKNFV